MAFDFGSELSDDLPSVLRTDSELLPLPVEPGVTIRVEIPWMPPKKRRLYKVVEVEEDEWEPEYGRRYNGLKRRRLNPRRSVRVRLVLAQRFGPCFWTLYATRKYHRSSHGFKWPFEEGEDGGEGLLPDRWPRLRLEIILSHH